MHLLHYNKHRLSITVFFKLLINTHKKFLNRLVLKNTPSQLSIVGFWVLRKSK